MSDAFLQLDPLHRLVLAYAKPKDRDRFALLFAIDSRFADIIRATSEILIGQMKLTWWRDILTMPPEKRPVGEPLVEQMNKLQAHGTDLHPLMQLIEGWEMLLEDFPWDDRQFEQYAADRGAGFFGFCVENRENLSSEQRDLSKSWALWDLARHCSDPEMRRLAFEKSAEYLASVQDWSFDRNGRPYSILCKLVARDVENNELTPDLLTPAVARKIIWHGLTGL